MQKQDTLSALLNAAARNNAHSLIVRSVKWTRGVVYVELDNPLRTAIISKQAYNKIKDYLVIEKQKQ